VNHSGCFAEKISTVQGGLVDIHPDHASLGRDRGNAATRFIFSGVIPRLFSGSGVRRVLPGYALESLQAVWIMNARNPSICRTSQLSGLVWLLLVCGFSYASSPDYIEAGLFSSSGISETLPAGWQPLTFRRIERHTGYYLVEDAGMVVVKAVSDQSASGLTRAISVSPQEYPVIQWRWKVDNVLQQGDVASREGDDYPARIYITFAFDPDKASYLERLEYEAARLIQGRDVPYRAISYIWGSNSPVGTMGPNAYTNKVMMFVVESGTKKLQQWVTERRNVYEDYRRAFAEEPSMISGVAIMTDTDNTRESAVAWYGDIVFSRNPGGRP
jgi:hypothetical protein